MSPIFEFLFVSELSPFADPGEIASIVRVSRANSVANELTGALIFDGVRFCQLIEGPEAAVRQEAQKIALDTRHARFLPLHLGHTCSARRFDTWHVGFLAPDGPSPLLAFDSLQGPEAINHLAAVFQDRVKLGIHVM